MKVHKSKTKGTFQSANIIDSSPEGQVTPDTNWNSSRIAWTNCQTFQRKFVCSTLDECQLAGVNGPLEKILCVEQTRRMTNLRQVDKLHVSNGKDGREKHFVETISHTEESRTNKMRKPTRSSGQQVQSAVGKQEIYLHAHGVLAERTTPTATSYLSHANFWCRKHERKPVLRRDASVRQNCVFLTQ